MMNQLGAKILRDLKISKQAQKLKLNAFRSEKFIIKEARECDTLKCRFD